MQNPCLMEPLVLTGFGYEAWVLPSRGGSLIRLARPALGAQSVRTPSGGVPDNPYLYGTPLLFPPNRIEGGQFVFDGREYALPVNEAATGCFLHGTLHETAFSVETAAPGRVHLRYSAPAHGYLGFPHAFTVDMVYMLTAAGLTQRVTLTNDSAEPMPAAVGFHTTFQVPFAEGSGPEDVRLMVSVGDEYVRNMRTYLPTWEVIEASPLRDALTAGTLVPCREVLSRHFRQGAAHRMVLSDVRSGIRVVYETPDYDFWMIYNGGAAEYICVEPQTCVNNAAHAPFGADRSGWVALGPGEARRYESRMSIERG